MKIKKENGRIIETNYIGGTFLNIINKYTKAYQGRIT